MVRLLLLLLLCASAHGASFLRDPALFSLLPKNGPAGPSPILVIQTFEGTDPDGWNQGTWGAQINSDYTTNPLEGSQSLFVTNASEFMYTYTNFTTTVTEAYFYFEFEMSSFDAQASWTLSTIGSHDLCGIDITTGAKLQTRQGGDTDIGTTTLTAGTHYYVWGYIKAETTDGAGNGICRAWLSTTSTKPGSIETESTGGTEERNANACSVQWFAGADAKFDNIKVSQQDFQ